MVIKITTWNIKWFGQLLQGYTRTIPRQGKKVTKKADKALQKLQLKQIAEEIRQINSDILCIQEGPSVGNVQRLEKFCTEYLEDDWSVIVRDDNDPWLISGVQGIFFLVKSSRLNSWQPRLMSQSLWIEATEFESRVDKNVVDSGEHKRKWPIIHPQFKPDKPETFPEPIDEDEGSESEIKLNDREHNHYRHPQVLLLTINGKRVDIIGCHLKSKFGGELFEDAARARADGVATGALTDEQRELILKVEQTAVESRIKLSTEITNVRYYIDSRFRNEPDPIVFVVGDLNDGVGKEAFERKYLFHDLVSNIQGNVFLANRFLNHALFDFSRDNEENHRWTSYFIDLWDPARKPEILLDHILFTQSVSGESALKKSGIGVLQGAGRVEHAIHNSVNSVFGSSADFTSDHRPVTVDVELKTIFT